MDATSTPTLVRQRDIVAGSVDAEAVYGQYEALRACRAVELLGRVFHGSASAGAYVALAAGHPAAQSNLGNDAKQPLKKMIHLGSSDYAGLNRHPRVIDAAVKALQRFGNGSTGGRLLNGTTELHVQLEQRLAAFVGMEDALTYNSGYCANLSARER
jgi:glycine C-acetyltransferase